MVMSLSFLQFMANLENLEVRSKLYGFYKPPVNCHNIFIFIWCYFKLKIEIKCFHFEENLCCHEKKSQINQNKNKICSYYQ